MYIRHPCIDSGPGRCRGRGFRLVTVKKSPARSWHKSCQRAGFFAVHSTRRCSSSFAKAVRKRATNQRAGIQGQHNSLPALFRALHPSLAHRCTKTCLTLAAAPLQRSASHTERLPCSAGGSRHPASAQDASSRRLAASRLQPKRWRGPPLGQLPCPGAAAGRVPVRCVCE